MYVYNIYIYTYYICVFCVVCVSASPPMHWHAKALNWANAATCWLLANWSLFSAAWMEPFLTDVVLVDEASREKERLEEKQRAARKERAKNDEEWSTRWGRQHTWPFASMARTHVASATQPELRSLWLMHMCQCPCECTDSLGLMLAFLLTSLHSKEATTAVAVLIPELRTLLVFLKYIPIP